MQGAVIERAALDIWTLTERIAPVTNPVKISVAVGVAVGEAPRDENYINLVARASFSIR